MTGLLRRLRARFRYRRFDDDLAEEMAFHQAMKQQELEQQNGLSAADARDAARREMGNITHAREASRGVWIASWLESVWQDIVYAVRSLRRQPAFTFAALAALVLGIGLNSSAFTIFNAVGLRPWPVPDPSRVVRIYSRSPGALGRAQGAGGFGIAEYRYLRTHTRTFSGLIATRPGGGRLGHEEAGQETSFEYVSDNYFDALGVDMTLGRGFLREEDQPASPRAVVVISHRLWTRLMNSDPAVLGRTLRLGDIPLTIVGVAAPEFTGSSQGGAQDLWLPLSALRLMTAEQTAARNVLEKPEHCCSSMAGRLAPGVTWESARAELGVLSSRYHAEWKMDPTDVVLSSTAFFSHPNSRRRLIPTFSLMFGMVLLVLLLACANVGNLLLARGMARRREIAIRLSLGASRARVVRQLLTEGMVLSCVAGAAAAGVAYVVPSLLFTMGTEMDLGYRIEPDRSVLIFTFAVSVLACMLFALAPALRVTRLRGERTWRFWRRGRDGRGARGAGIAAAAMIQPGRDLALRTGAGTGLRGVLLAVQLAMSVVLLVSSGLLMRGVQYAADRDPGFVVDDVMVAAPMLPQLAYDNQRRHVFATQLESALREDQDLRAVGLTALVPLGNAMNGAEFRFPGQNQSSNRMVRTQSVSTGYFDVLGIPLIAGRMYQQGDGDVILINEEMARQYFAGQNPVGQTLVMGPTRTWQIIGIVRDAHISGLDRVYPMVFGNYRGSDQMRVLIRPRAGIGDVAARVKAIATRLEPRAQVDTKPLAVYRDRWLMPQRVIAAVAGVVSLLALMLASIGVFGVFAFIVQERTREIGIRMAIGARASQVVRLVLASTSWATAGGLLLGLAGAIAVTRLLEGYLYGVGRFDVVTFATVAAVLAIAALVATYVPVRRATRVDPATALRCE
jgi:macrolide transport system ATP-binding/permease protein